MHLTHDDCRELYSKHTEPINEALGALDTRAKMVRTFAVPSTPAFFACLRSERVRFICSPCALARAPTQCASHPPTDMHHTTKLLRAVE